MSFWRGKRVVVTGGAGLVGSHLCDLLVEAGSMVTVVDDLSKGTEECLLHLKGRIIFQKADLCNPQAAIDAFKNQEIVMHLASRAYGIAYSVDHDQEMLTFNRQLNSSILNACEQAEVERLCAVSSSSIYPDDAPYPTPELPTMTGEPEKANSGYGWSKRHLEIESQELAQKTGIKVAIVRPFNAYSGRYKWEGMYSHVIPSLVKRLLDGENPLVVWGSGNQSRNFLHAIDFARCFMAVTEMHAEADPVNVGYEEVICMKDLAQLIGSISGKKFEMQFDTSKPEGRPIKSADSTKLRKVAGNIEPSIPLKKGIEEMVEWYDRCFGKPGASSRV
jgi:nucleoside-diphosphate-sugar epimerase